MLKEELKEAGFGNFIQVFLDADKFGVPQKRKRFFLLASRFQNWNLSCPEPDNHLKVNVQDAFAICQMLFQTVELNKHII